jgi:two-component system nitrate/nitrite response regulator NarP
LGGEQLRYRPRLSPREAQLVLLVQQAKTNKEIAAELQLTPGTAKQYMHALFRKLGIRNRTELAMWGSGYLEA